MLSLRLETNKNHAMPGVATCSPASVLLWLFLNSFLLCRQETHWWWLYALLNIAGAQNSGIPAALSFHKECNGRILPAVLACCFISPCTWYRTLIIWPYLACLYYSLKLKVSFSCGPVYVLVVMRTATSHCTCKLFKQYRPSKEKWKIIKCQDVLFVSVA